MAVAQGPDGPYKTGGHHMNGYTSANHDSTTPLSDALYVNHDVSTENKINFDHQLHSWLITFQISIMTFDVKSDQTFPAKP